MKQLRDRVAVITGAGGGVGSALAHQLADQGCHLALVDISEPALAKVAGALASTGVNITTHVVDITDKAQVAALPSGKSKTHRPSTSSSSVGGSIVFSVVQSSWGVDPRGAVQLQVLELPSRSTKL